MQKLLPIYLVIFFGFIGYSLIITIFTPLLLNSQNTLLPAETSGQIRILILGVIIFLYPFGQFLSSPVLGALSDRLGRRPVLVFSLAISTLVYFLVGIGVWLNNLWMIAICLLLAGLSEGNVTIAQSIIADLSPKNDRSRFFGYIYLSASLSYIFGPLIGGKLSDPSIIACCSYESPFFAVSLLLLVIFVWVLLGFKESLFDHRREKVPYFEAFTNLKHLFYMKRIRYLFITNLLLYLAIFGFFQSFPIYIVHQFNVDVWKLSLYIAWSSAPFLIVNLLITGMLSKRFSSINITIVAAIWTAVFLEVFLIPADQNALWITLFLVGLGASACLPSMIDILSSATHEKEQGRVMGINQSLQFFAEAFSGLVVGLLAALAVKLALIIFGFISLIGAFFLAYQSAKKKQIE